MYLLLLCVSLAVFLITTAIYLRQPFASLLHPITLYLAFHGFVFVLRPFFAYFYDFQQIYSAFNFQPSLSDKMTVIAGSTLAMVTYVFVSMRIAPMPPSSVEAEDMVAVRSRLFNAIVISIALFTPIASWSQVEKWMRSTFSYDDMILDAGTGAFINTTANGWFTDISTSLAPIAVMLVWLGRYRPLAWGAMLLFCIAQAGTGTRGPIIYALAAVSMIYLIEHRRRWFDMRVAFTGILALLAFNAIVNDRGASIRGLFDERAKVEVKSDQGLKPLEHMDFGNLEFFEYLVYAVPQRTGSWDYFAQNLQIFTEPVPRALWRGKPVGSPVKFYELWDYGTPIGMTQSLPGAGWTAFGWLGIMIQAAFFAWLYGNAYRRLLVQRNNVGARMIYVLFASTAIVTYRDGTLLTLLRVLPFYLGPWLVALGIYHVLKRPVPGASGEMGEGARSPVAITPADRRRSLAQRADAVK